LQRTEVREAEESSPIKQNGFVGHADKRQSRHCEQIFSDLARVVRSNAAGWIRMIRRSLAYERDYFALVGRAR